MEVALFVIVDSVTILEDTLYLYCYFCSCIYSTPLLMEEAKSQLWWLLCSLSGCGLSRHCESVSASKLLEPGYELAGGLTISSLLCQWCWHLKSHLVGWYFSHHMVEKEPHLYWTWVGPQPHDHESTLPATHRPTHPPPPPPPLRSPAFTIAVPPSHHVLYPPFYSADNTIHHVCSAGDGERRECSGVPPHYHRAAQTLQATLQRRGEVSKVQ